MRAALQLILMAYVLWCALGIAEPAEASAFSYRQDLGASSTPAPHAPDQRGDEEGGQAHHHHCPVAPDLAPGPSLEPVVIRASVPVRSPYAPLGSLTRAPPLQPPARA